MTMKPVALAPVLMMIVVAACSATNFGGTASIGQQPQQAPAAGASSGHRTGTRGGGALPGAPQSIPATPAAPSSLATSSLITENTGAITLPSPPGTAQVSGAFSVWLDPAQPQAGQGFYKVVTQIRLTGAEQQSFSLGNFVGSVSGTGGFYQSMLSPVVASPELVVSSDGKVVQLTSYIQIVGGTQDGVDSDEIQIACTGNPQCPQPASADVSFTF